MKKVIKPLCLILNILFPLSTLAGWRIEQQVTTNGNKKTHTTSYYETNRYRQQMGTEIDKTLLLFDGKNFYTCHSANKQCYKDPMAGSVVGTTVNAKFKKYSQTPTGKSATIAGYPCKEFIGEMEMTITMPGSSRDLKTTTKGCYASTIDLTALFKPLMEHFKDIRAAFFDDKTANTFIKNRTIGPPLRLITINNNHRISTDMITLSIHEEKLDPFLFTPPKDYQIAEGRQLAKEQTQALETAQKAMLNMKNLSEEQREMMNRLMNKQ